MNSEVWDGLLYWMRDPLVISVHFPGLWLGVPAARFVGCVSVSRDVMPTLSATKCGRFVVCRVKSL